MPGRIDPTEVGFAARSFPVKWEGPRRPLRKVGKMKSRSWTALAALIFLLLGAYACPGQSGSAPAMQPFTMDHRADIGTSSLADLSFLLDAPAGHHGFIREANAHLETGDGHRIRFWGANVTDWSPGSTQIPLKQDAPIWAATLARYGVNCVRLQFLDFVTPRGLIAPGNTTGSLDPEQMDREDYFLAQLEKRGIYIDFNLLVGRPFKPGDGVTDAQKIGQGAKGISLYDPKLIELQKTYARELLTHYNPYTKRTYRDDPGVAIVEINNENAIWVGFRGPSPFYDRELDAIYNVWLRKNAAKGDIWAVRKETGVSGNDPVPLLSWPEVGGASLQRYRIESEFYLWLESSYFSYMREYLRNGLGVKCVILATADHNHNSTGYPLELALSSFKTLDGHDYWEGPWERKSKSPMVSDPLHSTVVELSRSAVKGKAYTVSEVNEPFPNDYEAEQIPILAAYGDLQDWDAILWYTFEPKKDPRWKPYVGDPFDLSLDPIRMTELASGALIFLRGDVNPARETVTRSYSRDQVFDSYRLSGKDSPYFTPGFPLWLPLQHGSRISSLDGPPTAKYDEGPRPNPIVSDTGQLTWNVSKTGDGAVIVDSPRTQAMIGFTAAENRQPTNLSAEIRNSFSAIVLVSLDGKPIAQSSRLLLTAGSRVANTDMKWNASHSELMQWGVSPPLIEPVTGDIDLNGLDAATGVTTQPLNGAGRPLGPPLTARRIGNTWRISVGQPPSPWYVITIHR
jgi:hypothetical protein